MKVLVAGGTLISIGLILIITVFQRPLSHEIEKVVPRTVSKVKVAVATGEEESPVPNTNEAVNLAYQETESEPVTEIPAAIQTHHKLRRKVLMSEGERRHLKEVLSEREGIDYSLQVLSRNLPSTLNSSHEFQRLMALDFLADALRLSDPETAMRIADQVVEHLLKERIRPEMGYGMKKSLAGDQIELFQYLAVRFPEKAQEILTRSLGSPNHKVYAFAQATLPAEEE